MKLSKNEYHPEAQPKTRMKMKIKMYKNEHALWIIKRREGQTLS